MGNIHLVARELDACGVALPGAAGAG